MSALRVTFLQNHLVWEAPKENCAVFEAQIKGHHEPTDLFVLPEMFNTGFSMQSSLLAESMDGPTVQWMLRVSREKGCVLLGSLIIEEAGNYYNRMVWVEPTGVLQTYDKRHLFRMADEHAHFSAGQDRKVVELKGWKLCLQICYDLRFPVFARNVSTEQYDALIYVANWPEARRDAWTKLLYARAIENQCYVVGVNRIGVDGKGIAYAGDSMIVDPKGQKVSTTEPHTVGVETVVFDRQALEDFRAKFPVGLDADQFELRN